MGMSVNSNVGAMVALQNLSSTQSMLQTTQNRIATGLSVSGAKDDSATFAIAQKLRGDLGGLKAVTTSLNRAKSTVDVAVSGAQQVSDILNQMKEKATAAADTGLDQDSRDSINEDFKALRDQITSIVKSANFNGTNLLDGGDGNVAALKSLQDGDATAAGYQTDALTISNQDLALGSTTTAGTNITIGADTEIATSDDAALAVDAMKTSISNVNKVMSTLGSASRQIDAQVSFTSKLSDAISSGVGTLVDADMAKESATLQALQVKQQLGVQALSIANQAPQSITSLFR
jgi:flagellin